MLPGCAIAMCPSSGMAKQKNVFGQRSTATALKFGGAPMGKVDPGWPALFIVLCELSNDSLSKDPCQFLHAFLAAV
jgi:hypothetical protein